MRLSREINHTMTCDIETRITDITHCYNLSGMLGWKEGGSLFLSSVW